MEDRNEAVEQDRSMRETDTREFTERPKQWQPSSTLPEPDKLPGYKYRWIRVSAANKADAGNVASKFREGWEPVAIEEQPQFKAFADPDSRYTNGIEVGGLLLCKIANELAAQRDAYYANRSRSQMEAVDNNLMRENDKRMPLFQEKKSTVSFGNGK